MIALCEDKNIIGTPFYIMNYIEGKVYESILEVELIKDRKDIYLLMVKMLAELHNVNYEKVKSCRFWKAK